MMFSFFLKEYELSIIETIISAKKDNTTWCGKNDKDHYLYLQKLSENKLDETININFTEKEDNLLIVFKIKIFGNEVTNIIELNKIEYLKL